MQANYYPYTFMTSYYLIEILLTCHVSSKTDKLYGKLVLMSYDLTRITNKEFKGPSNYPYAIMTSN